MDRSEADGRSWNALTLELPEPHEEDLAFALAEGSLGAESLPGGSGRARLRLYTDTAEEVTRLVARARRELEARDIRPEDCEMRVEEVRDGHWVERYQAGLEPFPLGQRFTVYPAGEPGAGAGRTPIVLVPGRAFGTGEHATTRLCAAELERRVEPGSRWIDLGCGSAILSLVARHSGALEVLALDVDEQALGVAREVLRSNGLGEAVTVRLGSVGDVNGEWDGIVANISARFFESAEQVELTAGRLCPGGVLIATGFQADDEPDVTSALGEAGLTIEDRREQDGWVLLASRREA